MSGVIKSTLLIESTTVFPTPIAFGKVSLNAILGDFSTFGSTYCDPSNPSTLNLSQISGGVALVYVEALPTNDTPVYLQDSSGNVFVVLYPGQLSMFPYGQTALGGSDIQAVSAGPGINKINYVVAANVNTTTYNISINSFVENEYIDNYFG